MAILSDEIEHWLKMYVEMSQAHNILARNALCKLIEAREDYLKGQLAEAQAREQAACAAVLEQAAIQTGMFHMFVKVGPPPRLEYLGFDHAKAALTIRALIPTASGLLEQRDKELEDLLRHHTCVLAEPDDDYSHCKCGYRYVTDYSKDHIDHLMSAIAAARGKVQP